jgi:hypothetical protein
MRGNDETTNPTPNKENPEDIPSFKKRKWVF